MGLDIQRHLSELPLVHLEQAKKNEASLSKKGSEQGNTSSILAGDLIVIRNTCANNMASLPNTTQGTRSYFDSFETAKQAASVMESLFDQIAKFNNIHSSARGLSTTGGLNNPKEHDLYPPAFSTYFFKNYANSESFIVEPHEQSLLWNFDNNNGSEVVDYLPLVPDYEVQGYGADDELAVLNQVWNWDDITNLVAPSKLYYKATVTYLGEGRIKLWDTSNKTKSVEMHQNSSEWTRLYNGIHVEGTEMSSIEKDVEVSIQLKLVDKVGQVFFGTPNSSTRITIGPIMNHMTMDKLIAPHFLNGTNGRDSLKADAEIRSITSGPGNVVMIQFMTDWLGQVQGGGGSLATYINNEPKKLFTKYISGTANFPYVDTLSVNIGNFTPEYTILPDDNYYTMGKHHMILKDSPILNDEIPVIDTPKRDMRPNQQEVGFNQEFRTFTVAKQINKGNQGDQVIYRAIGYIEWTLIWNFSGNQPQLGVTVNNSDKNSGAFTKVKNWPNQENKHMRLTNAVKYAIELERRLNF